MKQNTNKEKNKKLYKNWKLYATVLAILGIGTATGLGIYYGTTNYHEVGKTSLNNLNLETTIIGKLNISEEDAFNAFLETNKDILGDNLTRNQVKLSNFQTIGIVQNGTLTITVNDENNKYTGSINLKFKYLLNKDNFTDIAQYFSDNNLFNFKVKPGYTTYNLIYVLLDILKNKMTEYYEYESPINSIRIQSWTSFANFMTNENLNTSGFTINIASFWARVGLIQNDDSSDIAIEVTLKNITFTVE